MDKREILINKYIENNVKINDFGALIGGHKHRWSEIKRHLQRLKTIRSNKKMIIKRSKIRKLLFMIGIKAQNHYFTKFPLDSHLGDYDFFDISTGLCRNVSKSNLQRSIVEGWAIINDSVMLDDLYPVEGSDKYCSDCLYSTLWLNEKRWDYLDYNLEVIQKIVDMGVERLFTTNPLTFI